MVLRYILAAWLLISLGCSRSIPEGTDLPLLKDTVTQYTTLLAQGYRNLDMTLLQKVSTEKQAQKAYYHMAALGEGKARMIAHITNLQFIEIDLKEPKKAIVNTAEEWDYKYVDVESGEERLSNSINYKLKYLLVKQNKQWLVDDVDILDSKQTHSKTLPFIQRPSNNPPGSSAK